MTTSWEIIDSGILDPASVMAKDARLLEERKVESAPCLHLYEWSVPCLTYGYFIDPHVYLDVEKTIASGLYLARRPTGGGIIFHLTDFAFSILIPEEHPALSKNTLQNYALINRCVAKVVLQTFPVQESHDLLSPCKFEKKKTSFCMAEPTPFDLIIGGKKAGGAAQRRTRKGLLHQGTISLAHPPYTILEKLLKDPLTIHAFKENSYCFLEEPLNNESMREARQSLKEALSSKISGVFESLSARRDILRSMSMADKPICESQSDN